MMTRHGRRSILWIVTFFMIMAGCVPKNKQNEKGKEESAESQDANKDANDSEVIVPPASITGSYLYCEINDKELATANRAEVGCRVDDGSTKSKVDLTKTVKSAGWFFQRSADPNILINGALASTDSPYHVLISLQGGAAPLPVEALQNLLVMFKANPVAAASNQFIFSARLAKRSDPALILPEQFPVYYGNGTVINNPAPGFERRILPTVNHTYPAIDGCYIACYSNSAVDAVYPVAENIHVMGQIRVKGLYNGRFCVGDGLQASTNYAEIAEYKEACGKYLPACAGNICWGGNDTGGWFGFQ